MYFWKPSIAPSSLLFYTGNLFPEWKGSLFVGAMADKHMVRLILEGDRVTHEEQCRPSLRAPSAADAPGVVRSGVAGCGTVIMDFF